MRVVLDSYHLQAAKRLLIVTALETFESLEEAAESLGISVRTLKRDMVFARVERPAGMPTTKKAAAKQKAPAKKAPAKKAAKKAPAKKKTMSGGRNAR